MFPDLKVTPDGKLVDMHKFALLRHPFIGLAKYNTEDLFEEENDNKTELTMQQHYYFFMSISMSVVSFNEKEPLCAVFS
jgi:glycerophosphoryl diester phosphodiesterase